MARKPKKNPKSAIRNPKLTERDLRAAGLGCESIEAAAERLGVADLPALLAAKPKLAAAWERGRFLREVLRVAKLGIVAAEADRYFTEPWQLQRGDLAVKLKHDHAMLDVWMSGQSEVRLQARVGLMERVKRGEVGARTMAIYEDLLLESRPKTTAVDWDNITQTQLEMATGIKRAQWGRWVEKNGCPRKASGRYSLPAVIAWLREYEDTGGVKLEQGLNPMQAEKLRRYKLENDETEGRLVPQAIVGKILAQRATRLLTLLSEARAQEWSQAHEGKTAAQLKPLYLEAFRQARLAWKEIPDDLPLPEAARAKIEEGLALLIAE